MVSFNGPDELHLSFPQTGALFKPRGEGSLASPLRMVLLSGLCPCAAGSFSSVLHLVSYPGQTWGLCCSPVSCCSWIQDLAHRFVSSLFLIDCVTSLALVTWLSAAPGLSSFMDQPNSCCLLDLGSCVSCLEVCCHILIWFLASSMAMYTCVLLVRMLADVHV